MRHIPCLSVEDSCYEMLGTHFLSKYLSILRELGANIALEKEELEGSFKRARWIQREDRFGESASNRSKESEDIF